MKTTHTENRDRTWVDRRITNNRQYCRICVSFYRHKTHNPSLFLVSSATDKQTTTYLIQLHKALTVILRALLQRHKLDNQGARAIAEGRRQCVQIVCANRYQRALAVIHYSMLLNCVERVMRKCGENAGRCSGAASPADQ